MLYSHIINMHIYTYTCWIQRHKEDERHSVLEKYVLLTLFERVCVWEGVGDQTELQYIDPHSYGYQRCVFLVLQVCSTGGPGAHSLLDAGFLYRILSPTGLISKLTDFLSLPSYIIVQSPSQYLWNGMFDRHEAEITVMQFTGHSLPVHQSMTVPWDFTLYHIVSQAHLRNFFP